MQALWLPWSASAQGNFCVCWGCRGWGEARGHQGSWCSHRSEVLGLGHRHPVESELGPTLLGRDEKRKVPSSATDWVQPSLGFSVVPGGSLGNCEWTDMDWCRVWTALIKPNLQCKWDLVFPSCSPECPGTLSAQLWQACLGHTGSTWPLQDVSLPEIVTTLGSAAQGGQGHSDRETNSCRGPLLHWKPLGFLYIHVGCFNVTVIEMSLLC